MTDDPTRTLKPAAGPVRPGDIIAGKYRIRKELGRGGMGVVYEAEDIRLKRTVALKFLPPETTADPAARERFVFEAQAASGLDDPHICNIHDIDETGAGAVYIAMACYKGESLKERLAGGPLEAAEAVGIALQAAEGLAKAHEHGIVHRDVKPGNIFLAAGGTVKLLDFGLAKLAGSAAALTAPGTTVGTVAYMSPEQARGDAVDARTDVWSLGVVLYEMATGELPFGREREQAILHAVLHEPPRPVAAPGPGLPAGLEGIIRRALEKEPANRFPSAAEMAAALRELRATLSGGRAAPSRRWAFRRSRRPLVVGLSAGSLVLAAAAVWLLTRPGMAFESRDKLMVADAENLTGDKVFDLALRTAIEAALQQSPYAAVFDKPQIADTLRLMRVDAAARIDETLGAEVCRFAGVRAFILPRILAAGDAYELEAILVDPVKKRHVDRIRVAVRGREDVLLTGIDDLARRLRSRLGESIRSVEKAARPVATVTTSSWEALNYFSLAQAKRNDGKFKEAEALYELALDKDPKFVAARGSLALVLIQFLKQPEKGKAMMRQALQDAESQKLPERDVLPLKANVRQFADGDLEGALAENRMIMELFPDLMPPYNNGARILQALGRYDEAAALFEEAAKRAPKNSIPLQNLYYLHLFSRKDVAAAEAVARRFVDLSPVLANPHSLLGFTLAVREKFDEAAAEMRKALAIEPDHPYALPNLGHTLYAAGRSLEAVPCYRRMLELVAEKKMGGMPEWDCVALVLALRDAGQVEEAAKTAAQARDMVKRRLGGKPAEVGDWIVLGALAAAEGNKAEAETCLKKVRVDILKDPNSLMDLAEVHALLGDPGAAGLIKRSLAAGFSDPFFPVILPEFRSLRKDPEFRALFQLEFKAPTPAGKD